ncbi:MAG: peptide chain release factor 2 [bacterium]|nr:peptide chain release factor 2 [bacterium]
MEEYKQKIKQLTKRLDSLISGAVLAEKRKEILSLEANTLKSDFWSDTLSAQETMRQLSDLKTEVADFEDLKETLTTLSELADLETSNQEETIDFESEIEKVGKKLDKIESLSFLSGPYDKADALLSIHSGQGGTEAMDWAAMLLRMYLRFAERKSWSSHLIEETKGEEAGIKSATIEIKGKQAYGLLKNEAGTHRLVRQSPFNADALRQTSFTLVEVLPVIEQAEKTLLNPEEIEMEAFRSSGPGGQNVQKVNTAVRLRHKPTGLVITAQSERSQLQNKENALKLLTAKLYALEEEKRAKEERQLKGQFKVAGWGNQIRSYVLHPYKQVKDLRTGLVSTDPNQVLDGHLEPFIEAELRL